MEQDKLLAAAMRRLDRLKRNESFDPTNPDSEPTQRQQEVFDDFGKIKQQWIRAGNQSGKSATCARILSWVITDTHPTWNRPEEWREEPILAVVAGRTGKQIEESLVPKILSYLEPGSYRVVKTNNSTQKIEMTNGNRIVFQSLENPNVARERLMSYVAHLTWCDELPPNMDVVRELQVRTQARNGYNLWSFTPTVMSVEIQRYVDSLEEPEARVYRFNMLDNPLYSDPVRREELMKRYAHLPEDMRKAIFQGDWLSSDDQVYYFNYDTMVSFPVGYSPLWRHVESVDPAISSALGLTVWAEDPQTHIWYCIISEYIRGLFAPKDWVEAVREYTKSMNIVRRVSDYAPWYINQAATMGIHYSTVYNKNTRKDELIKQLQQFLGTRIRLSPTCESFISELQECRWSERSEGKMVNSSSYHLLDSAQYFCDLIPKAEEKKFIPHSPTWQTTMLLQANQKRLELEEKAQKRVELTRVAKGRRRTAWR